MPCPRLCHWEVVALASEAQACDGRVPFRHQGPCGLVQFSALLGNPCS